MKYRKFAIASVAAFALSVGTLVPGSLKAGPSKGGKGAIHMSEKGRANSNAQWMADPVKGWVRAEERHEVRDEKQEDHKKSSVKQKGKGKKKTH